MLQARTTYVIATITYADYLHDPELFVKEYLAIKSPEERYMFVKSTPKALDIVATYHCIQFEKRSMATSYLQQEFEDDDMHRDKILCIDPKLVVLQHI